MNTRKLSIVLSTQAAQFEAVAYKGDLEANLAKIACWGYDGVELAIRDPDMVDVDKLIKSLAKERLSVPAIGTGQAWGEERLSFTSDDSAVRRAAVERIKRHIFLAERLKANVIIGLIRGITPKGQSHSQSIQYLIQSLRECLDFAVSKGVRLALEPINRYETDLVNTTNEALDLIEQVGSEDLGMLLDTFHMNIEEPVIEDSIQACGKRIFHFHVADSNRKYPGGGHLDFKSILTILYSTGYRSWVSGEFIPDPDPDTAALRSINYLKQIIFKERE